MGKKSMKEEADSDDDNEEEQKNESNKKLTPKRQLFKKNEKWKTKTFNPFNFKYNIAPFKDEQRSWSHPVSFDSIKPITTKPDDNWNRELSDLRNCSYSYGKKITVEYNKKHIFNDKDVLQE